MVSGRGENTQNFEYGRGKEDFVPKSSQTPPFPNSKPSVIHFGGNKKQPKNGFKASRWLRRKDP